MQLPLDTLPTNPDHVRAWLKDVSNRVTDLVRNGDYPSINAALLDLYARQTGSQLKTILDWVDEGYQIKSGAVGLPIWGPQVTAYKKVPGANGIEKKVAYTFYKIKEVFSEAQVEPLTEKTSAAPIQPTAETPKKGVAPKPAAAKGQGKAKAKSKAKSQK